MVVRERGANRVVDLESALGGEELDPWRLEGVITRKQKRSPVETALEGAVFEPKDQKVPGVDVTLFGRCDEVGEILTFQDHFVLCLKTTICHCCLTNKL